MARNETVQIHTLDALMQVFRNIKCPIWGLLSGTRLLVSYNEANQDESEQVLQQCVEAFCEESAGIYTLVVYKNLKPGTVITNRSEYTNSIGFRLNEDQAEAIGEARYVQRYGRLPGQRDNSEALKKVYDEKLALAVELEKLKNKPAVEPPETMVEKISGVIEALGLAPIMPQIGMRIADMIIPPKPGEKPLALAGPKPTEPVSGPAIPQNDAERKKMLADAMEIMGKVVPDLAEIMMKFALFSQENPPQFQMYIDAMRKS